MDENSREFGIGQRLTGAWDGAQTSHLLLSFRTHLSSLKALTTGRLEFDMYGAKYRCQSWSAGPRESSAILGIFRPLFAVRMDWGDLPFRYVRKQRCALLNDMLALKSKLDKRQTAVETFAEDTEDLIKAYGLYPPVALYDACFLYPSICETD